jgi:hypothetical protein
MRKTKQGPKLGVTRSRPAVSRSPKAAVEEIDARVIAEAEDDTAWERSVRVSRKQAAIGLPASLAQRAAFLARLHREQDLQSWVERVVRERVELEEQAFTQARRELASKPRA